MQKYKNRPLAMTLPGSTDGEFRQGGYEFDFHQDIFTQNGGSIHIFALWRA